MIFSIAAAIIVVLRIDRTGRKGSGLGDAFTYDLKTFHKTDPTLIKYEETNKITTGFQEVFGVAVEPNDQIYVAGDNAIRIFNDHGDYLSEIALTASPRCLAVTDDGAVYLGMKDYVEVYDPKGVHKDSWEKLGRNTVLTSIAVSGNDVFLADAGDRVVLRYDTSGKLVNRMATLSFRGVRRQWISRDSLGVPIPPISL